LKYVQEQYKSLTSSGAAQWIIKATFASNDPPASKYIRRILLASIRHTQMSPNSLIEYLFSQRLHDDDPRVAAKSLYLVLLLIQYETDLSSFSTVTVKIDQVLTMYSQQQNRQYRTLVEVLKQISNVIRTKIMLHVPHNELEGNLAFGNKSLSENLENDLTRYLATISDIAEKLINIATQSKDYCVVVLIQPIIDEVSNAYKLLSFISKTNSTSNTLKSAKDILEKAKKIPYIQSSIVFPNYSQLQPPLPRFVVQK